MRREGESPSPYLTIMIFKYQLIFLGDIDNPACKAIRERIHERIREMGILEDIFLDVFSFNFHNDYQNKQPSFVYYFGKSNHQDRDKDILSTLMSNGDPIIPLYFTEGGFYNEIPEVIQKMNGKQYQAENLDAYVNYALESLRLLRKNRKLFISYRRTDSTKIANQLFDALIRCNYDVFLDAYSIPAAENFQEELHHRLSDCDVLIQLYTSGFKDSPWCKEEITAANQKQIGVVEIVWPDVELDRHNYLCEPFMLNAESFDGDFKDTKSLFKDNVVSQLSYTVESVRVRNMAARQDNLVGEFISEAEKQGKQLIQEYVYLIEHLECDRMRIFIPAVGVPQSYDCFDSLRFKEHFSDKNVEIYLIYDDLRVKKAWIQHLDWLNDSSLEVKTIKKKEFTKWLKEN